MTSSTRLCLQQLPLPDDYLAGTSTRESRPADLQDWKKQARSIVEELCGLSLRIAKDFNQHIEEIEKKAFGPFSLSADEIEEIHREHQDVMVGVRSGVSEMIRWKRLLSEEDMAFTQWRFEWERCIKLTNEANHTVRLLNSPEALSRKRETVRIQQMTAIRAFRKSRLEKMEKLLEHTAKVVAVFQEGGEMAFNDLDRWLEVREEEFWPLHRSFIRASREDKQQLERFRSYLQADIFEEVEDKTNRLNARFDAIVEEISLHLVTMGELVDPRPPEFPVPLEANELRLEACLPRPHVISIQLPLGPDAGYLWTQLVEGECHICTEPFKNPAVILGCEHAFCLECAAMWINRNRSCPTCRGDAELDSLRRIVLEIKEASGGSDGESG